MGPPSPGPTAGRVELGPACPGKPVPGGGEAAAGADGAGPEPDCGGPAAGLRRDAGGAGPAAAGAGGGRPAGGAPRPLRAAFDGPFPPGSDGQGGLLSAKMFTYGMNLGEGRGVG